MEITLSRFTITILNFNSDTTYCLCILQVVSPSELTAILFHQEQLAIQQSAAALARVHTQVDYIHCLIPDLQAITTCSFYWGKMDRYEAERLLEGKPEGEFV